MPTMPTQEVIEASTHRLDPHAVLEAIVNETPELARALVDAGLATELTDDEVAALEE